MCLRVLGVLIAVSPIGCAYGGDIVPPPPDAPAVLNPSTRSVDSGKVLDEAVLDVLISNAEKGDGNAALRVSLHFGSVGDAAKASYWLAYAAARGDSVAQYNLWFIKRNADDCPSKLEALAWLKSAAVSGGERARGELEPFALEVQECLQGQL